MDADDVQLGAKYRDTISGWVGVATGRYEYLNGCVRVELSSSADGKPDGYVFDTQQIEPEPDSAESADDRVRCGPECSEMHTFEPGCEQYVGRLVRVDAPTAAQAMAVSEAAARYVEEHGGRPDPVVAEAPPEPVHPLVRFWRWLWDAPQAPEPPAHLGLPGSDSPWGLAGKPLTDDSVVGPLTRTGGPRSTPPRTGSR